MLQPVQEEDRDVARSRWRERLVFHGPLLSLGLVLLMLWGFVAWFALIYPQELLRDLQRDLASSTKAAAV
ncbi:MAG: hypothetical protein ABW005_14205, partial [Burkholderiaceae bacterium]